MMKERILTITGYLVCLFTVWHIGICPLMAQSPTQADNEFIINGVVRDRENRRKLENVTISLAGMSMGTVTNADGVFSLKIPRRLASSQLEFSHIGYQNSHFSSLIPDNANDLFVTIWMTPASHMLDEVVVFGGDARRLVEEALKKIPANYPNT